MYEDHTSSYGMLLEQVYMSLLHFRRQKTLAIETFNIVNKLAPVSDCPFGIFELFVLRLNNSKYFFTYNNIMDIAHVITTHYGKKRIRFAAAALWNVLLVHFRSE